jgi:hypothetical protein
MVGLVLALVSGVAYASIPGSDGLIHACRKNTDGSVRVIDTDLGQTCASGWTAFTWNQTGPQGATGATGATGAQGDVGPQGPAGPSSGAVSTFHEQASRRLVGMGSTIDFDWACDNSGYLLSGGWDVDTSTGIAPPGTIEILKSVPLAHEYIVRIRNNSPDTDWYVWVYLSCMSVS